MPWKVTTTLIFLAPFALLWLAFAAHETRRALSQARALRRGGR